MADDITTQAKTVQNTAANIQRAYLALQKAKANISGLLAVGKATCDDVKAYNLWAIAVYNTQLSLLATAKTAGDAQGLPTSISRPPLVMWNGVSGESAWKINCNPATNTLHGALRAALSPPTAGTVYLSTQEARFVDDADAVGSSSAPSYGQLVRAQQGLGGFFIPILIAGAAVVLGAIAVKYLFDYLKEQGIQEETSHRNAQALEGYALNTKARLDCYTQCKSTSSNTDAGCIDQCNKLIGKAPELALGPQRAATGLGILGTVGLIALAAVGGVLAFRHFSRRDHVPHDYAAT